MAVMTVNQYVARSGAPFGNAEAQAIGEELEKLGDEITPHDVVKAARRKRSPLHPYIEWDDAVAADAHRIEQARSIMHGIAIRVTVSGDDRTTRAFHNVRVTHQDADGEDVVSNAYVPMDVAARSADYRGQVIEGAKRELRSWRERFKEYTDVFSGVIGQIDAVLDDEA